MTSLPPLSCGCSRRGADMGRTSLVPAVNVASLRFHLVRLRLDSGGYDAGGAYWGHGKPLYRAVSVDKMPTAYRMWGDGDITSTGQIGHIERFMRTDSRTEAKELVREAIPNATFFR